jgi:hypothetical protein
VPTAAELQGTGLKVEDYAEVVEVWPENWPSWCLWVEMGNQWRIGMAGIAGLDYTPLFLRMDRMNLDDERWNELFHDVRVCEAAALREMRQP